MFIAVKTGCEEKVKLRNSHDKEIRSLCSVGAFEGGDGRKGVGDAGKSRLDHGADDILCRLVAAGRLVDGDVTAGVDHDIEALHLLVDLLLRELTPCRRPRQPPSAAMV